MKNTVPSRGSPRPSNKKVASRTPTEVNERAPKHLYRGARFDSKLTALAFQDLPPGMKVDEEDESTIDEEISRMGARDRESKSRGRSPTPEELSEPESED